MHLCIIIEKQPDWTPNEEEGELDGESDVDDCAGEPDSEEMNVTDGEQVVGGEPMQIDWVIHHWEYISGFFEISTIVIARG